MEFILTVIGVIILLWLIEAGWKIFRAYRQMNKTFKQATGQSFNSFRRNGFNPFGGNGQNNKNRASKKKKRIIPQDYGEYVEFVETKEEKNDQVMQEPKSKHNQTHENQISDAEWEEIK